MNVDELNEEIEALYREATAEMDEPVLVPDFRGYEGVRLKVRKVGFHFEGIETETNLKELAQSVVDMFLGWERGEMERHGDVRYSLISSPVPKAIGPSPNDPTRPVMVRHQFAAADFVAFE